MNAGKRLELALRRRFPAVFITTITLNRDIVVEGSRKPYPPHAATTPRLMFGKSFDGTHAVMLHNASKFILNTFYGAPCARI